MKHPVIYILVLIAGNLLSRKIWSATVTSVERVIYTLLIIGLTMFASFFAVYLDEFDEIIQREETERLFQ